MNQQLRSDIIALIHKEVVPAIGCTEPIAVALCTARAAEALRTVCPECQFPEKIDVLLSANILKNAMGVGIPGTGMIGLPIAIALGVSIGRSEYMLEGLNDINAENRAKAKEYIQTKAIAIGLKEDISEKLYSEVTCTCQGHTATAIISGSHTNFVLVKVDDNVILDAQKPKADNQDAADDDVQLNLEMVWEFATTAPLEEIAFVKSTQEFNMNAAHFAIQGNYGHNLGKTIDRPLSKGIFGNSIFSHIIARTAAACDARMGGAMVPVMSNSGSGNQGICATNPVAVYAIENENTEEELIRALTLSHLTAIYIKQSLGKLSALCGCVVASIGSSCGITYLMGGDYNRICSSVKNMIANLTGMICDGAKPSCALKIVSGVSTAVLSALLSMEGHCVSSEEGIIDNDVDQSIHNLTSIGKNAMCVTDDMILNIMTNKS